MSSRRRRTYVGAASGSTVYGMKFTSPRICCYYTPGSEFSLEQGCPRNFRIFFLAQSDARCQGSRSVGDLKVKGSVPTILGKSLFFRKWRKRITGRSFGSGLDPSGFPVSSTMCPEVFSLACGAPMPCRAGSSSS